MKSKLKRYSILLIVISFFPFIELTAQDALTGIITNADSNNDCKNGDKRFAN